MSVEKKGPEKVPAFEPVSFPVEGPSREERYRLEFGMTDADRKFRQQWLQDQILAEGQPVQIPGFYEARFNPIRRASMWPLNTLFKPLYSRLGHDRAFYWRYMTGKSLMALWVGLGTVYYFKYNAHDWTSNSGWRVYHSDSTLLPGDAGYGDPHNKHKTEYADFGFKQSPI